MIQSVCKRLLPVLAITMIISSCSSSKNAASVSRNDIKGTWQLNQITYEGLATSERLSLALLEEGNEECLRGSTWVLPNNGYGSYTITANKSGCLPGQKNIVWSYHEEGDQATFQYKKLPGGEKAKEVTEGYKFKILSASDNAMVLQSNIFYQGKPIYINYSFSK